MKYEAMIEEARKLCGCMSCQGGYKIGVRTLALYLQSEQAGRPGSCVAAVVLADMLRQARLPTVAPLPPVDTGKAIT